MVNRKTIVVMRFFPSPLLRVQNSLARGFGRAARAALQLAQARALRSRFPFQIVTGAAASGQLNRHAKQR